MKRKMLTAGITAAIMAAQSMPAQAINREWSAIAGFAGGILVANSFRGYNRGCDRGYYRPAPCPQPVYYQQPVYYCPPPVQTVVYQEPVRSGYYELRNERVWVPGYWVYEDRGCGVQVKVWQPGFYQMVQNRVWVDTSRVACGW